MNGWQQPGPAALARRLRALPCRFTRHPVAYHHNASNHGLMRHTPVSEATTAYTFLSPGRVGFPFTSYWLRGHSLAMLFSAHIQAQGARFSILLQVSGKEDLSKFVSPSPQWVRGQ